ncbi:MAG: hypothetical protein JSU03_08385 [Bacteroidetes bacterium]|nr:hypothetical protein [Bacteroidota bacterium]MBS1757281.1 hypothetical protein [Bacteroidota bacterium]
MKKLLFYFLLLLLVSSCTYDCFKSDVYISCIGFSTAETDSIVLKKFTKNSGFVSPLDSAVITPANTRYKFLGDTLKFVAFSGDIVLDCDYDYEVYFPKMYKKYQLNNITEEQRTQQRNIFGGTKEACLNTLSYYNINGQVVDASKNSNIIYIKNQ